jgi:hypothetical protein
VTLPIIDMYQKWMGLTGRLAARRTELQHEAAGEDHLPDHADQGPERIRGGDRMDDGLRLGQPQADGR